MISLPPEDAREAPLHPAHLACSVSYLRTLRVGSYYLFGCLLCSFGAPLLSLSVEHGDESAMNPSLRLTSMTYFSPSGPYSPECVEEEFSEVRIKAEFSEVRGYKLPRPA